MRKVLSAIGLVVSGVVAFSALSALAGCGGGTDYNSDNFLPNGTADNPYKIVDEPVTISVFVPRGGMNPHYSDMKMFKKLSEITNLIFDFNEVDTSAYSDVRSVMWEDKRNLPDLFLYSNPISELVVYSQYGAFTPFNDADLEVAGVKVGSLIDNYMPNYKRLLDSNFNVDKQFGDAKAIATLSDGYMYSALSVQDVPRDLTYKMFLNQKWIENLRADGRKMPDGSEIPDAVDIATVEEMIEVFRLFKQYDANHNGDPNDEIPVSARELEYFRNFVLASYGYVSPGIEIENDDSAVVYVPRTEAYRKYMSTMNLLYSEGLLDRSTFTIKTDEQLAVKGLEGRLGCFCAAAAYITVGYDHADDYVAFGPLTSDYYRGTPLHWGFGYFYPDGATIPTGTPYVREIARLLDIMYSELGTQLIAYGEENVDWTWDDESKTSWTFNVPSDWSGTQEEYRATITPNVGTGSGLYWSYEFVGKMNDHIIRTLNQMSERYLPYLKVPFPPEIKLTGAEYNTVARINASLEAFLESEEHSFIAGDKNIETDWDKFLSDLDRYGAAELTELYDTAWRNYHAGH